MEDADLRSLLEFDPLGEAEQVTGLSYKDDEGTMAVGFVLLQAQAALKKAALTDRGDTVFRNDLDRYVTIIEDAGFEEVYFETFLSREQPEQFFIYWHPEGLLLVFDTYLGDMVNGSTLYYNWRPKGDPEHWFRCTSSGCMVGSEDDRVWSGNHDGREALLFHIDQLRAHGDFVNPWVDRPSLWLAHHGDDVGKWNEPGYGEKRELFYEKRLAALPAHVREGMGV